MARFIGLALLVAGASAAAPCCKTCTLPLIKYYSVDRAHGFCGDACMDPKKFSIYKKFEANLTLVDADHPDCAGQYTPDGKFYTDYDSTVTHGDPFGILAVTLDLYAPTGMPDHSCCSTPIKIPVVGPINCKGKPQNMTIRGTGPYCCPATATEEKPCPIAPIVVEPALVTGDHGCYTKCNSNTDCQGRCGTCLYFGGAKVCIDNLNADNKPSAEETPCSKVALPQTCNTVCRNICCKNGGGDACVTGCGCDPKSCPPEEVALPKTCNTECRGICCTSGGGDACVTACGCEKGSCPPQNASLII